ncbi:hypothetical protein [Streptomyces sp. NPDC006510]|uniref:hypothetical protein n=1 Tax=Streptomyces sp. NPDC006510 TaxID=3155600 RepID=UPI0033B8E45D
MDLDIDAVVPAEQSGDVLLELPPVHGIHGGHDSDEGALFLRALEAPQLDVVPDGLRSILRTFSRRLRSSCCCSLDVSMRALSMGTTVVPRREETCEAFFAEPCDAVVE